MDQVLMLLRSIVWIGVVGVVVKLYHALVVKPQRLRSLLKKQGIDGPPPTFLLGNIKDIRKALSKASKPSTSIDDHHDHKPIITHNASAYIFPFFDEWRKKYGQVFMFALGNTQILFVNQPDVVREITTCTSLDLGKPTYQQRERGELLGQGVLTSNGPVWAHQRKILAPELYMDKVKGMISIISLSATTLIESWNSKIDEKEGGEVDIRIDDYMRSFSGDVISRACFGSNFSQGQEIFLKLRELQEVMSKRSLVIGIPGLRHIPTKHKRAALTLEKEIRNLILKVAKGREESGRYEKDLLQMVLEGAKGSNSSREETNRFVVDNCKNIYLAGYETTAIAATWCLMLLASNPHWQDRVRAEVQEICKDQTPDYDSLLKMKSLTMVIHELLRLYPPVSVVSREAFKDMRFGNITVPKGVIIWTLVLTSHTDPEVWGEDSYKFNPERFANGITGACKLPYLYMPFGMGQRVCLGEHLAMVELKMLIALIVSNFSFSLSPQYNHSPTMRLVIEPNAGLNLLVKKV